MKIDIDFESILDVSTSMTYIPGTGPQPVFPAAQLRICPNVCPMRSLQTSLTLHTEQVGAGCDRETYSLASQRKLCGASSQAAELLPAQPPQQAGRDWMEELPARKAGPVYQECSDIPTLIILALE